MESELSTPRLFKLFDELTTLSPMSSSLMVTFDLQTTINSGFEGFNLVSYSLSNSLDAVYSVA